MIYYAIRELSFFGIFLMYFPMSSRLPRFSGMGLVIFVVIWDMLVLHVCGHSWSRVGLTYFYFYFWGAVCACSRFRQLICPACPVSPVIQLSSVGCFVLGLSAGHRIGGSGALSGWASDSSVLPCCPACLVGGHGWCGC